MITSVAPDPRRRPPRPLILVVCGCGTTYTLTPEEAARHLDAGTLYHEPTAACA